MSTQLFLLQTKRTWFPLIIQATAVCSLLGFSSRTVPPVVFLSVPLVLSGPVAAGKLEKDDIFRGGDPPAVVTFPGLPSDYDVVAAGPFEEEEAEDEDRSAPPLAVSY